ncbi:hypothetical protein KIF53_21485 [Chromobacterium subtsugae]|uniref:Lipoprotein n=1 Tax=Chromobacterium subtsugae TaxID=251747 RepID=A0ABS7FJT9_9NEIS|nr:MULTISPECIES: hypothetical protein [Chromobacterium]MBW7569144.1 hypothetical protein [Chromobacterium subtsugae]MBW8290216.1 hypothetical protein [Chromobacterium subtsugae]WSE91217.1 hypothetical protein U6115_20435 [Chromobacterium subtsugae]WVH59592.1 hypothetical protein U6151_20465 [Chromobacterium subtsugae]
MAILKLSRWVMFCCGSLLMSCCAEASECENLVNNFFIQHWKGEVPKKAVLYRYPANGNFTNPIQVSKETYRADIWWPKENKAPTLIVKFSDYGEKNLPVDADYKLILGEGYQFKISKLEKTRVSLGCQLGGGRVNSCKTIFGGEGIAFNRECAEMIKE